MIEEFVNRSQPKTLAIDPTIIGFAGL